MRIALVAHDNKKPALLDWARSNAAALAAHHLVATGTTGRMLHEELGLDVKRLRSGPIGSDSGRPRSDGRPGLGLFDLGRDLQEDLFGAMTAHELDAQWEAIGVERTRH